jgi:hypothetical protein
MKEIKMELKYVMTFNLKYKYFKYITKKRYSFLQNVYYFIFEFDSIFGIFSNLQNCLDKPLDIER